MVDKKFLADIAKEINSYSRDEDYPLRARVESPEEIIIYYPAGLGTYSGATVVLSDASRIIGESFPPGRLYIRGINMTEYYWESAPRTPWERYFDSDYLVSESDFLKVLARLKKKADKQMNSTKIHTKKDPDADKGVLVFRGVKKIGEVWKGLDRKWHHSETPLGYGGFNTRKEAMEDLLKPANKRTLDYQPFDGFPRLASAKDLLKEVREIKAELREASRPKTVRVDGYNFQMTPEQYKMYKAIPNKKEGRYNNIGGVDHLTGVSYYKNVKGAKSPRGFVSMFDKLENMGFRITSSKPENNYGTGGSSNTYILENSNGDKVVAYESFAYRNNTYSATLTFANPAPEIP